MCKKSARFFYYSKLKDMNALKVLSDTNKNNFDMTVSYKSDFTPRYNTLCLIINHL